MPRQDNSQSNRNDRNKSYSPMYDDAVAQDARDAGRKGAQGADSSGANPYDTDHEDSGAQARLVHGDARHGRGQQGQTRGRGLQGGGNQGAGQGQGSNQDGRHGDKPVR